MQILNDFMGRLRTGLGAVQAVTMFSFISALFIGLLLLRHETDDYFTPLSSYFSSIKVAFPPAAIFVLSYAIAFITGASIAEAPKTMLSFARNTFFQSRVAMVSMIAVVFVGIACSAWILSKHTPPAYELLTTLLLGGSADNLAIVREKIVEVRKADAATADRLLKVVEVFAERDAINAGAHPASADKLRVFIRALEAEDDPEWIEHPLRKHALAEAYSMFGQSFAESISKTQSDGPKTANQSFKRASELYAEVASSGSPLAPPALRISARMNGGNVKYYEGDYASALGAWRAAQFGPDGQPKLGAWSNMVAALVKLDRASEAVEEGERARAWAERTGKGLFDTYAFAGVLENTAFAKLQTNDLKGAVADFASSYAFRGDDLSRQNLALAFILAGRESEAGELLRRLAPPLRAGAERQAGTAPCVYLIWALAMRKGPVPDQAANFAAFLGTRYSADELRNLGAEDFRALRLKVKADLPKSSPPCSDLADVKAVAALLEPN